MVSLSRVVLVPSSRKDEAETAIRQAIHLDHRDAFAHARLAMMLRAKRSLEEAEEEARTAVELDPKCESAWSELGSIHFDKKNFGESKKAIRKALDLEPDDFALSCDFGLALAALGELGEAQAAFGKAVELIKSVPRSHASLYYVHGQAIELARFSHWSEAFDIARFFIDAAGSDEQALSLTTDLAIRAAAKDQVDIAIEKLEASPAKDSYEPLLVALRILKGEHVNPPVEIAEVAEDIIKRVDKAKTEEAPKISSNVD